MIASNAQELSAAVLAEMNRAENPRLRQVLRSAVRHLHAFASEVQLTEAEFQQACAQIARLGQLTTPSHNEVVLCAGSLGLSALVCLLNNHGEGDVPATANLHGPFWRDASPPTANGASIMRSPTLGEPIFVTARVHDPQIAPAARTHQRQGQWRAAGVGGTAAPSGWAVMTKKIHAPRAT